MSQCRSLIRTLQSRIKQEFQHLTSTPVTKKHRESPPLYSLGCHYGQGPGFTPIPPASKSQPKVTYIGNTRKTEPESKFYIQEKLPYHRHTKHTTHRNGSCNQFQIQWSSSKWCILSSMQTVKQEGAQTGKCYFLCLQFSVRPKNNVGARLPDLPPAVEVQLNKTVDFVLVSHS